MREGGSSQSSKRATSQLSGAHILHLQVGELRRPRGMRARAFVAATGG